MLDWLGAGERVTATLKTTAGDANLTVWGPSGNLFGQSALAGIGNDVVTFTANVEGIYQFEASASVDCTYKLRFEKSGSSSSSSRASLAIGLPSGPVVPVSDVPPDAIGVPNDTRSPTTVNLYVCGRSEKFHRGPVTHRLAVS